MQLKRARISGFRSLRNVSVEFGAHTAFIGGNGAGKSSILKAIDRFYSTARSLDPDDFYGRNQDAPIEIELTFGDLTGEETEAFESRVRGGELTVVRVFDQSASSGSYYGSVPQNADFRPIRSATTATEKRNAYRALKDENPAYAALPSAASAAAVDEQLALWEQAYPEALTLERDDGRFFGFQNASRTALNRYTNFVFVPAVREAAADATDSKSSPIGRLVEILVRSSILKRADVQQFQHEMIERYRELIAPGAIPELDQLAIDLTADLQRLYAQASVGLAWREIGEIPVPLPAADVILSDDGFGGPVGRQGHGLQRAFVFTLLQHLAGAATPIEESAGEDGADAGLPAAPTLILAIEEPELYQHPTKQRHVSHVLRQLSAGTLPGATGATQIIFASHSPMFVSLRDADEIRLVRRTDCENGEYKQCSLCALDLNSVARKLERCHGKPVGTWSAETLKPRLHILGTELAEGFFADGVVLVEGRSDRAALSAAARLLGVSFEEAGIAVLSVEGKNNLDRPYLIFRALGIPTYVAWDCDCGTKDHKPVANLALCRMTNPNDAIEVPVEGLMIAEQYSHFEGTLEKTIKAELTPDIYDACLKAACEPFGFDPGTDAQKVPDVMFELLAAAANQGCRSSSLEGLVKAIWLYLTGRPLGTHEELAVAKA